MMINPEALISAASLIGREWGHSGYGIEYIEGHGRGSALLKVCAGDGGRFFVGSTRYGNTVHGEDYSTVLAELLAEIQEEARP